MAFTVYKSSAGSGKTFTLVKEYISLCLAKPDNFRHILAITFTNKAAAEMKERVIKYLTELSAFPTDECSSAHKFLLPDLLKSTGLSEEKICSNAQLVLNSILHNYSDFAIGTIDSFVHRIIRSFAHDLNIPMNFEVEMDTDKLLSEAIDLLLNKAGSDALLTKILVEFTEAKIDDEKSWHIEKDLLTFARQLFMEDNMVHIDKLKELSIQDFLDIRKKLDILIAKFENEIIKIASAANKLICDHAISIESFYRGTTGIGKYFQNLANGNIDKINPNSYVLTTVEEDKWYAGKATAGDKAKIDEIKTQLGDAYLEITQLRERNYRYYILHTLIHANIYPVAVLNEIEKIIDDMKKEENILPISEFNKRISGIVVTQPVPFIYERLGERYQNYLVDEFQDTSGMQWMNMLPLIENSLGYDNFNMIVGDGKQAIYRWRGGDVEQFALLPELPKTISDKFSLERIRAIKANFNGKNLVSNFRSKAEIIDFNNKFFSYVAGLQSDYIKSIYDQCTQIADAKNTGGYIQLDFAGDSDGETKEEITLKKIEEIISELKDHEYSYNDIAILCRSNSNASVIARHLTMLGINVISEESLLISGSHDVNFLLAFASFISNNEDDVAKYRILHYLLTKKLVADNDLYNLCKILRKNNSNANNSIPTRSFSVYLEKNNLTVDVNLLAALPVYELFERLIYIFKIDKFTDPYVRFFLDAVFEFSSGKKNNVSEFLDWWEEQKDKKSIIIPSGLDAVNIMTIHKSKGLEFPVVIYPFATEMVKKGMTNLWVDTDIPEIPNLKSALVANNKNLKETEYSALYDSEQDKSILDLLNVLYVALTRPSERLYVITKEPTKIAEPKSIPDYLASFLLSLEKWNENTSLYSFGKKVPKPGSSHEKSDKSKIPINRFSVKQHEQVIHLRRKATDLWDTEDPLRNSEWGNLIHHILSLITYADTIDSTVAQLLQNGMITNGQEAELTEKIKGIIADPALHQYFQPGFEIRSETEILLKDGSIVRPDRVVTSGKNAVVIDYKTGRTHDSHKEQIRSYGKTLEELGYTVNEKILVYIDKGEVVKVD